MIGRITIYLLFLGLFFWTSRSNAQTNLGTLKVSELKNELRHTTNHEKKITIYKLLANKLRYKNSSEAKKYALKGLKLSTDNFEKYRSNFTIILGKIYRYQNQIDSAKYFLKQSISFAKKESNPIDIADGYMNLGILYKNTSKKDSAMYFYNKAENEIKSINTSDAREMLLPIKINKANIYENHNKQKAIKELLEVEKICLKNNLSKRLPDVYSNLANIFFDIKDYDKALKYHKKSLNFDLKNHNDRMLSYDYAMIANTFHSLKALDSSFFYANKSIKLAKKFNDLDQLAFSMIILTDSQIDGKKYSKAEKNAQSSLKLSKQLKNIDYQIFSLLNLGTAQFFLDKDRAAEKNLLLAEKLLSTNDLPLVKEQVYNILMKLYYKNHKIERALKYDRILDSIQKENLNIEKINAVRDIEIKYQTQQKEAQILKLSNENIKKEAALAKTRFTMYAIGGTSIFLIGLGFLFWQRRRQQQKLEVLASAVKASEAEKQRIGKELHDGIAGSLIKLVYETEADHLELSDKMLKTYNEVRKLSHQLNNTPMHDEIFAERIEELLPDNLSGKQFKININPSNLKLPEPYGTHLYRIIQELIANNLKYAQATETEINIVQKDDTLYFEYKDNGIGTADLKEGSGLNNITDRVTLMKGEVHIQSAADEGFSLNFAIHDIPITTKTTQQDEPENYKYSYN